MRVTVSYRYGYGPLSLWLRRIQVRFRNGVVLSYSCVKIVILTHQYHHTASTHLTRGLLGVLQIRRRRSDPHVAYLQLPLVWRIEQLVARRTDRHRGSGRDRGRVSCLKCYIGFYILSLKFKISHICSFLLGECDWVRVGWD